MPGKGWVSVNVKEDVRRRLEDLASELGFTSLNDVIAYLIDAFGVMSAIGLLDEKLNKVIGMLSELKEAGRVRSKT
jgi:hypothetical protein